MTNNNITILFRSGPLALIETLRAALYITNGLGAYHEVETGGTFGAIANALKKAIWCEIRATNNTLRPDQIDAIVNRLYDEAIDNGENIDYQIHLWNKGIITL